MPRGVWREVRVPSHIAEELGLSCGWALDGSPREEEGMAGVSMGLGGFSLYRAGGRAGEGLGVLYFFLCGAGKTKGFL